jgi:hypothetical protein
MIRGYMRKLSKVEVRDYARTLVPILESHDLDGTKSIRIADAIISYAMKGLKPWYRRGSALQGFPASPSFNPLRVIEGFLVYPIPGMNPVTLQSATLGNAYLFLDIVGAGGGGGGGASGALSTSPGNGQSGGGGGDGGRLVVMTQGPLPAGTQLIPQLGGNGGAGGRAVSSGIGNPGGAGGSPGDTQVILGGGSITISTSGASAPAMPTPISGNAAGGVGGNGGSAIFTYLSTTSILTSIQIAPRTIANANGSVNNGPGGYGVSSEYFNPSNARPIFISGPVGTVVSGGGVFPAGGNGGNGQSATVNVPSGMIPLRGSGAGGGGGTNSQGATSSYAGGNGGPGGPGPIIILVIE